MEVEKVSKKVKRNMGRMARRKGHQFERDVAILLRDVFPDARRHLEYQDAEANGVDLVETGLYRIQCKRGRKYASIIAIEEVQCDTWLGEIPVLITQGDNKETMAVLPFSEFKRLLRKPS